MFGLESRIQKHCEVTIKITPENEIDLQQSPHKPVENPFQLKFYYSLTEPCQSQ